MTVDQEDALYDYLDDAVEPFASSDAAAAVRRADASGARRIAEEVDAMLRKRRLAFPVPEGRWLSRRAAFEGASFAIAPTRLEIRNGILIPGHRCLPYANPILLPHEMTFLWRGEPLPVGTSEGPPEDFYPYYDLFGEEYAPQYVARDNPGNQDAFNADPYEDPPEVSVRTLDMRAFYRETGFVPGDRLSARMVDWKAGVVEVEKADKAAWTAAELAAWEEAALAGFAASFDMIGPGASTEEQIAFAARLGGERLLRVPAYSFEEFLYEKTDRIDTVTYGMETRFWKAGRDIPDSGPWTEEAGPPDKTDTEALLASLGVPVSEYVVESYVRDAFFRRATDIHTIIGRLLPPPIAPNQAQRLYVAQYLSETREDLQDTYNPFLDKDMGPLRQRAAELHTAVVELAARLAAEDGEAPWLPKHVFVTLSQLQVHAANLLEDLDYDDPPEAAELEGMEISLDGMIDTYDDVRESVDQAREGFRKARLTIVREEDAPATWRAVQIAVSGTGAWRRLVLPESFTLSRLHRCIQAVLGWTGARMHGFVVGGNVYGPDAAGGRAAESAAGSAAGTELSEADATLADLVREGVSEFSYDYDYGAEWEVKITLLHPAPAEADGRPRCIAGELASPTERSGGPLRYRRFASALRGADGPEKELARAELGAGFDPDAFDPAAVDAALAAAFPADEGDPR